MRALNKTTGKFGQPIGVLDIGSSKITCLIVGAGGDRSQGSADQYGLRIAGIGHQRARGIKSGVVTDLGEAEQATRAAIAQAEKMAGVTLSEVVVAVACGRLGSRNFAASAETADGIVTASDIERLLAAGRRHAERDGRLLIHLNRFGFRLDGAPGARDPVGMAARRLSADLHAVTADEAPVRNLVHVVERCYLTVSGLVAAPYASALAATTPEERRLGVTCIDIGGGTTTIAVFVDGEFLYTDVVPLAGHRITTDVARMLQTPVAEAERIKVLYGTLTIAQSDEHEEFSHPLAGEEEGATGCSTKAQLARIVRSRVESILALAGEQMSKSPARLFAGDRVVLTGGTSQLPGLAEFAAQVLARPARVARPHGVSGLPSLLSNPAFSCAVGLLDVRVANGAEATTAHRRSSPLPDYLSQVGQWLREGF